MDRIRYCPFWILILQDCSIDHSSRYRDKIDNTAKRYRDRIDPHNQVTQQQARGWICVQGQKQTQTVCFSTRETAKHKSPDLLDLSHDACIVPVSDKTLFVLRERISQARDGFQITTWHCRIHRLMCSPSNSQSRSKHRKPMSRQGEESKQETRDKICLHCPAKTHWQQRENKTTPLCRFRTPAEGRVCSTTKNCVPQNGYNGKLWQHKDVHGSVSSCSLSLCECIQKLVSSHVHNVSSN